MSNTCRFGINLVNAEGNPANDPNCFVGFHRMDNTTIREARNIPFPPDHIFTLPGWPQEQNLYCTIEPALYRLVKSNIFLPRGNKQSTVPAVRLPDKWTPDFQSLAKLAGPRFDPFLKVVSNSPDVDVKHGPVLGNLGTAYDQLAGSQQILAKMALLNLYAVMTDEKEPIGNTHWFRFVQQIVRIDQERFVAEVDPALYDIVETILKRLDTFQSQGFFTEPAGLHVDNIPQRYTLTGDLITVKVRYEQGNAQFTMGKATTNGRDVALLDCDMDEHSNTIGHLGDLFIHVFTGGTHPIDMHEYIVHHDKGVQLGYGLSPIGVPVAVGAGAGN